MKTISQLVKSTDFTVQELADKLNVSKTTLEKCMNGTRTPNTKTLDLICYYAHEINPTAWHSGIIDYYYDTKDGTGTLRLLDVVNDGIDSIQDTDYELVKELQPYLSEGSARLVNDIITQKSGKE